MTYSNTVKEARRRQAKKNALQLLWITLVFLAGIGLVAFLAYVPEIANFISTFGEK